MVNCVCFTPYFPRSLLPSEKKRGNIKISFPTCVPALLPKPKDAFTEVSHMALNECGRFRSWKIGNRIKIEPKCARNGLEYYFSCETTAHVALFCHQMIRLNN